MSINPMQTTFNFDYDHRRYVSPLIRRKSEKLRVHDSEKKTWTAWNSHLREYIHKNGREKIGSGGKTVKQISSSAQPSGGLRTNLN